jgi:hypothetical protein
VAPKKGLVPNYETSFISDLGDEDLFFNVGDSAIRRDKQIFGDNVNKKQRIGEAHDSSFNLSVNEPMSPDSAMGDSRGSRLIGQKRTRKAQKLQNTQPSFDSTTNRHTTEDNSSLLDFIDEEDQRK